VIEVYIGLRSGGWALGGQTQAWEAHESPALGLERWACDIGERHGHPWRKARADLWLSGALARPFLFGPVAGIKGWREAEVVAAAAAPEWTGLVGPCRVRLEAWPGEDSTVCTALDASLSDAIESIARSCRITWRNVRPRWSVALDAALGKRPSTALFAVYEEDAFTLLCESTSSGTASPGMSVAATYSPALEEAEAKALWHRMKISFGVQDHDAVQVSVSTPGQGGSMSPELGGSWPPTGGAAT
jgi:hypothetical protein